jgi:hypothetical protein
MQVEPGALSAADQLKFFQNGHYYIFHYTYQFEYMLDGTPCQPWNIGEWSLDKRHFNDYHPAYPLPQPPKGANVAGVWLLNAWNEAMAANPKWPKKQPAADSDAPPIQTLYGRRRLDWFSRHANGFAQEISKNTLVKQTAGKRYGCIKEDGGQEDPLEFLSSGDVTIGRHEKLTGRWGAMNDPTIGEERCPIGQCLFVDFAGGGQMMNAHVDGQSLTIYQDHYKVRSAAKRATPTWRCKLDPRDA